MISYARHGIYILDDVLGSQPRLLKSFIGKTPLNMSVSPDNTQLGMTFFDDSQLFVMKMDGTGLRQLTVSGDYAKKTYIEGLSWSPDGRFIVVAAISRSFVDCSGRGALIVRADADKAVLPDF